MKRIAFLTVVFFFLLKSVSAICDCQTAGLATKANVDIYDLIFLGRVDSVSACSGDARVWFSVTVVYKGGALKRMPLYYDCKSDCKLNFLKGQEWLIYSDYERYGEAKVDVCSRSRRRVDNVVLDMYLQTSGQTFDEEKSFVEKMYGKHEPMEARNDLQPIPDRHNDIPSRWQELGMLFGSLGGLLLIYFLTKRFWKRM